MKAPAQLLLLPPPPAANVVEVDGNALARFVDEQEQQGRRVASMTVLQGARYRLHMIDYRATPPRALPPTASRDDEGGTKTADAQAGAPDGQGYPPVSIFFEALPDMQVGAKSHPFFMRGI